MRQGQPQNRQRTRGRNNNHNNQNRGGGGNNRSNLNRSLESNGPDVRIRGTASHIAEKYMQLANDAHTAGDTVAAQSYWQHAEHYNRVIAATQAQIAEQQAERQAREEQQRQRQQEKQDRHQNRDEQRGNREDRADKSERPGHDQQEKSRNEDVRSDDGDRRPRRARRAERDDDQPRTDIRSDNADVAEARPPEVDAQAKPKRGRKPKAQDTEAVTSPEHLGNGTVDDSAKPEKKTRRPRRKKEDAMTEEAAELPSFVTGD